jgi:hypothetical protein
VVEVSVKECKACARSTSNAELRHRTLASLVRRHTKGPPLTHERAAADTATSAEIKASDLSHIICGFTIFGRSVPINYMTAQDFESCLVPNKLSWLLLLELLRRCSFGGIGRPPMRRGASLDPSPPKLCDRDFNKDVGDEDVGDEDASDVEDDDNDDPRCACLVLVASLLLTAGGLGTIRGSGCLPGLVFAEGSPASLAPPVVSVSAKVVGSSSGEISASTRRT